MLNKRNKTNLNPKAQLNTNAEIKYTNGVDGIATRDYKIGDMVTLDPNIYVSKNYDWFSVSKKLMEYMNQPLTITKIKYLKDYSSYEMSFNTICTYYEAINKDGILISHLTDKILVPYENKNDNLNNYKMQLLYSQKIQEFCDENKKKKPVDYSYGTKFTVDAEGYKVPDYRNILMPGISFVTKDGRSYVMALDGNAYPVNEIASFIPIKHLTPDLFWTPPFGEGKEIVVVFSSLRMSALTCEERTLWTRERFNKEHPPIEEMTLEEIEKALGKRIKIVEK